MPFHAAFHGTRGTAALPGYFIADTPWAGVFSEVGAWANDQQSTAIGGGGRVSAGAQNNEQVQNHYFATGTFTFSMLHWLNTNRGIYDVQLDGSSKGTIDGYGASALNTFSTITGIALTAGLKAQKLLMSAKNASSSNYYAYPQTTAWARTGA